ncbi:hypothetical protein NACSLCCMFF_50015 [Tenacibaculum maritimum]|uniref:hypothetical protein n=1 Tax=Tenacibaculum maritimum TaxID=107401 RepID=UPI0012E5DB35|nr:hypothetical protein [Tenacibaculum maritimum]CAA0230576.1 hypothetical protein NACSLCCMFF_50015 [Tenacibaculum maritimum]
MNSKRLSLADFKAKAENVVTSEVLENISGGSMWKCHGYWGQKEKQMMGDAYEY